MEEEEKDISKVVLEKSEKSLAKSKQGKKNRAAGQRFEAKVRQELEELGWIVSKWMNTVDPDKNGILGKLVPAKRKFNPFMRAMTIGTGFPDFVCFKKVPTGTYEVIGLEVKGNGYLDQIEKGMCIWLLENKIFSRILIARKSKTSSDIEYFDFREKYDP
jgi:hypothetical protein